MPLIDDLELAQQVMASDGVDAYVARVAKPGKQPKKLVSCTGGVFFGRRGETWPIDNHGLPLLPWIQLVDAFPGRVHYKKAVCFFLSQTFGYWDQGHSSTDNGSFVVREYDRSVPVRPLDRPSLLKGHPFRRMQWQPARDYPLLSKYRNVFTPRVIAALNRDRGEHPHHAGIKIEGWPTQEHGDATVFTGTWDLQLPIAKNFSLGGRHYARLRRETNGWLVDMSMLKPE
jgi:hypothetical protein